jgi:LuxR family maltose regulon positive regulatory protein
VRIFVDEGEPMRSLISDFRSRVARQPPESDLQSLASYAGGLLAAFGDATMDEGRKTELFPSSSILDHSSLVEPLSERELEVLRLLKTELSGPEIARELVIALSTMRTHTQNIYGKLNVNNRRAAVHRAEELGLI